MPYKMQRKDICERVSTCTAVSSLSKGRLFSTGTGPPESVLLPGCVAEGGLSVTSQQSLRCGRPTQQTEKVSLDSSHILLAQSFGSNFVFG